jgi:2-polyprenyl-3-methyl-5-hydroxy-6-metoxy-1,4-benzoquinol methylase
MKTRTSVKKCRVCGNIEKNAPYVVREMMYGLRDEFQYFQCNSCGCLQIRDFLADMDKYYPNNYYSFNKYEGKKFNGFLGKIKQFKYSLLISGSSTIKKIMGFLSGQTHYFIFKGLEINKSSRILDVGCGNGKSFLYPLAEIGFKNLFGCDPYLESSLRYDNGLKIDNSTVFQTKGTWDFISYHHSFEHISDPLDHLKKVFELLKPNGVCAIRIPTTSSFAWEHYGVNWVQLDAPRHFFLHSRKSMEILAKESKLELYRVVYDSTHLQFSGSEKYIKDRSLITPHPKGFLHLIRRKITQRKFQKHAEILNKEERGDQAAFFFRKTNSQTC